MNKFKHFWVILAALTPLAASEVNAQIMFDLIAPVQEDIIRDLERNPRRVRHPNAPVPKPRSTSPISSSCNQIISRLGELHRQGVTRVTLELQGGSTITDSPDDLVDDVQAIGCQNITTVKRNPTRSNALSADESTQSIHPEASKNCDDAIKNVVNAVDAVDTNAPGSTVTAQQLQKVQQANQLMSKQCKNP